MMPIQYNTIHPPFQKAPKYFIPSFPLPYFTPSTSSPSFFFLQSNPQIPLLPTLTMAQKMDNDESELKVPENLPICTPPPPIPSPPLPISSSWSSETSDPTEAPPRSGSAAAEEEKIDNRSSSSSSALKRPRDPVSRCSGTGCRKRVGLIGFRCRCGDVFCADHRYSDRHDCSFDYKAAGREAIARENPVVRAAKLLKV